MPGVCYRSDMRRRYRLSWNPGAIAHIWRHRVVPAEVEDVCAGDAIRRQGRDGRIILVGPTTAGRMLAVVLELQTDGTYYPVTARPADRQERRRYLTDLDEKGNGPA